MTHDWQQTETGAHCSRCPAELTAENHDEACLGGVGVVVFESVEEAEQALSGIASYLQVHQVGTASLGRAVETLRERDALRARVAELEGGFSKFQDLVESWEMPCSEGDLIYHVIRRFLDSQEAEIARLRAALEGYCSLEADFPILEQHNGQRVDWDWLRDHDRIETQPDAANEAT